MSIFFLGLLAVGVLALGGMFWWRWQQDVTLDLDYVRALVTAGRTQEADAQLRGFLKKYPDHIGIRMTLADLLVDASHVDEALAVLATGLKRASDHRLHILKGLIHLRRAELGPGHEINSPYVLTAEEKKVEHRASWERDLLQAAVTEFDQAHLLAPEEPECAHALARALDGLERWKESAVLWERLSQDSRFGLEACTRRGHALMALGRLDEAQRSFEMALKPGPHLAAAHGGLSEIYHLNGDEEACRDAALRSHFYQWWPAFVHLPYDEEILPWIHGIRAVTHDPDSEDDSVDMALRKETLKRLLAEDAPLAKLLLCSALYHDMAHDELEVHIARDLVRHDKESRNLAILVLQYCDHRCVRGVLAHELADVGERRIVPALIEALSEDVDRSCIMDLAGALARLKDARAIQPLIDFLAPAYRQLPLRRPRGGWTHASVRRFHEDRRGARWRAALALGHFDDDRVIDALRRGMENPDVRVPCSAALFRRERDRKLLLPVPGHARGEDPVELRRVASYLDDIAPDYSTRLLDLVRGVTSGSGLA